MHYLVVTSTGADVSAVLRNIENFGSFASFSCARDHALSLAKLGGDARKSQCT